MQPPPPLFLPINFAVLAMTSILLSTRILLCFLSLNTRSSRLEALITGLTIAFPGASRSVVAPRPPAPFLGTAKSAMCLDLIEPLLNRRSSLRDLAVSAPQLSRLHSYFVPVQRCILQPSDERTERDPVS